MKIGKLQSTYVVEPVHDPVPTVRKDAEETPREQQEAPAEDIPTKT
jgi:hypothetical protein